MTNIANVLLDDEVTAELLSSLKEGCKRIPELVEIVAGAIDAVSSSTAPEAIARCYKRFFEACLKEGFTRDEAFILTVQTRDSVIAKSEIKTS